MKWYFAINEQGVREGLGLHAQLAVLSALRVGGLEPVLLYWGQRGAFTEWMQARGVRVVDQGLPFADPIAAAEAAGRYPANHFGHWLRTQVCLIEHDAAFVLYTDVDVVFLKRPDLDGLRPAGFAAAPEFLPANWNYFNAGVMLLNVAALREDYAAFESYIREHLAAPDSAAFNDQFAYNDFYRRRWTRLPLVYNWKPYWPVNTGARLLHLHGPKIGHILTMMDGGWDWASDFGAQVGAMFASHVEGYIHCLRAVLDVLGPDAFEGRADVERIIADAPAFVRTLPPERTGAVLPNIRMFGDGWVPPV